jgi:hypothetical protein
MIRGSSGDLCPATSFHEYVPPDALWVEIESRIAARRSPVARTHEGDAARWGGALSRFFSAISRTLAPAIMQYTPRVSARRRQAKTAQTSSYTRSFGLFALTFPPLSVT